MKKLLTLAVVMGTALVAGSASAAPFEYQGGLIKKGSHGTQVYNLQSCLRDLGVNARSNVDGIFGSKTKAAVMAFQAKNGVAVDGIIGPVTGPLYTAACAAANTVEKEMNLPEGCTTASGYSPVTGEKCVAKSDNSSTNMSDEEADVEVSKVSKEDDLVNNKEDQLAFTFEVEADEDGGDAKVERADLTFTVTPKGANTEADLYDIIEKVTVKGDSKVSKKTDDDDDWRKTESGSKTSNSSEYGVALSANEERGTVRVSGLNTVVKSDSKKEFKVYLDIADLDDEDMDLDIELTKVVIRYVDGAGVTEEEESDSRKKITVEGKDSLEIDLSKDKNQEKSETISLSEEDAEGVSLVLGEFEVDEQDGELEDVVVKAKLTLAAAATADGNVDELIKSVDLYIEGDKIDDVDVNDAVSQNDTKVDLEFKFDADDMKIKDGKEYKIEVKADFEKLEDDSIFVGSKLKVESIEFKGEADNDDDFKVEETISGTELTLSAGSLVLEKVSVKGFDKDSDASATASYTVEVKADGDKDIQVTGFVFKNLTNNNASLTKGATVDSGDVTYTVELKEDDDDGDDVDLATLDTDNALIKDGKKKTYYIEIFAAVDDTKTEKIKAELLEVTYQSGDLNDAGDALENAVAGTLNIEKETKKVVLSK